ncbi:hypothetical protein NDU88_005401 [Pleurodeles waltl]|uniref:Uncharacterized protein n=1 Tax=Pleurodeles waltl TaxID=8319 RepID=A0AAV7N0E1_PLEWA|nr:hypothetical protein NDU88_005401 [Pleurodeles waltl]
MVSVLGAWPSSQRWRTHNPLPPKGTTIYPESRSLALGQPVRLLRVVPGGPGGRAADPIPGLYEQILTVPDVRGADGLTRVPKPGTKVAVRARVRLNWATGRTERAGSGAGLPGSAVGALSEVDVVGCLTSPVQRRRTGGLPAYGSAGRLKCEAGTREPEWCGTWRRQVAS